MNEGQKQAAAQYAAIVQMLADLDAAEDIDDEDDARQRIVDHPLHVLVRSDWMQPGDPLEAAEFQILLCTGGPAVRIIGEITPERYLVKRDNTRIYRQVLKAPHPNDAAQPPRLPGNRPAKPAK